MKLTRSITLTVLVALCAGALTGCIVQSGHSWHRHRVVVMR